MVTDLLNTAAVQKLRGIIKSRYGKGLTLRYVVDSRSIDFDSATPQLHRGDLQIPIIVQDKFLGLATVPAAADLTPAVVGPLVDLVKMVLEPTLQRWFIETKPGADIQLFSQNQKVPVTELHLESESTTIAKAAFLYSNNPFAIPRSALTIHDSLQRWAFLHYSDLGKEIKSAIELQALGAVTLLIDDVRLISSDQMKVLVEFLETSDPDHEPLILIGSTMRLSEVQSRNLLDPKIQQILAPYEIEIDRMPRQSRQLEAALRMLLDSEAAQMIT